MDYKNKDMEIVETNDTETAEQEADYSDDSTYVTDSETGVLGKIVGGILVVGGLIGALAYTNRDKIKTWNDNRKKKKFDKYAQTLKDNGYLVHEIQNEVESEDETVIKEPIEEKTEE